jgi:hypothetical protein
LFTDARRERLDQRSERMPGSYKNYMVGEVMSMSNGYGFNILSKGGQPLVALTFETDDEAEEARAQIAAVVAKAVEITPMA